MRQKTFNLVVVLILGFAGGLHLIRSLAGWELVLGNFVIPFWVSWIVVAMALYIIYSASRLNKR